MKRDKRGDIPTLILVIGVFFVCAVAIFSFVFFSSSGRQSFSNVLESMAIINSIADQIRFYENAGLQPESFLGIKKENNNYNITSKKTENEEIVFYVEYIIPAKVQSSK